MKNQRNELLLSTASLWEIALKARAGKLNLPVENDYFSGHMTQLGVELLPIAAAHVYAVMGLPHHHSDPFDLLLVAQCKAEGLAIVASDAMIQRYPIPIIW